MNGRIFTAAIIAAMTAAVGASMVRIGCEYGFHAVSLALVGIACAMIAMLAVFVEVTGIGDEEDEDDER